MPAPGHGVRGTSLRQLVDIAAISHVLAQLELAEHVGSAEPRFDLSVPVVRFGTPGGVLEFPLRVLGSESADGYWEWAWATPHRYVRGLLGVAETIREKGMSQGIPEVTQPIVPVGQADALRLVIASKALSGVITSFAAQAAPGHMVHVLLGNAEPAVPGPGRIEQAVAGALQAGCLHDHRAALSAFARRFRIPLEWRENGATLHAPGGSLGIAIARSGHITSMGVLGQTAPRKPESAVPAVPEDTLSPYPRRPSPARSDAPNASSPSPAALPSSSPAVSSPPGPPPAPSAPAAPTPQEGAEDDASPTRPVPLPVRARGIPVAEPFVPAGGQSASPVAAPPPAGTAPMGSAGPGRESFRQPPRDDAGALSSGRAGPAPIPAAPGGQPRSGDASGALRDPAGGELPAEATRAKPGPPSPAGAAPAAPAGAQELPDPGAGVGSASAGPSSRAGDVAPAPVSGSSGVAGPGGGMTPHGAAPAGGAVPEPPGANVSLPALSAPLQPRSHAPAAAVRNEGPQPSGADIPSGSGRPCTPPVPPAAHAPREEPAEGVPSGHAGPDVPHAPSEAHPGDPAMNGEAAASTQNASSPAPVTAATPPAASARSGAESSPPEADPSGAPAPGSSGPTAVTPVISAAPLGRGITPVPPALPVSPVRITQIPTRSAPAPVPITGAPRPAPAVVDWVGQPASASLPERTAAPSAQSSPARSSEPAPDETPPASPGTPASPPAATEP